MFVIKKKISKSLAPLDGSKNSIRGLETAITLARGCGATITGIYSIYAPPYSEFRDVGSVEKTPNLRAKKFMGEARMLDAKHGIVFNEKMARGDMWHNIIKLAHGKEHFNMAVIGQEE